MLRRYENAVYGAEGPQDGGPVAGLHPGHWRSGTTNPYNLFAADPRFAYPNLYQVVFPHTFLSLQRPGARLLVLLVPECRLGDDMGQHLAMAAEDEFALQPPCVRRT